MEMYYDTDDNDVMEENDEFYEGGGNPDDMDDLEDPETVDKTEKESDDYGLNSALYVHNRVNSKPRATTKDLEKIMTDFRSGDLEKRQQAIADMIGVLSSYVLKIIHDSYESYMRKHLSDMLEQAYVGIIRGMENYNPSMGRPTTWFKPFIHHEIQQYLNEQVNGSTPYYNAASKKVFAYIDKLMADGKTPSVKDIVIVTGIPAKTVEKCLRIKRRRQVPIDGTKDGMSLQSKYEQPEDTVIRKEREELVRDLLSKDLLSPKERFCLVHNFGLDGRRMNKTEICALAREQGIELEGYEVPKLINHALDKLRDEMGRRNRERCCMRIRADIEINLAGKLVPVDSRTSDNEAVMQYLKTGLL